jgi:hypothetical protein
MPCGYSSYACDKRCSYKTPVLVSILDWRLGAMKYAFMLCILLYVGVYNIWYNNGYLRFETPVGHVRFQLQQPTKPDPNTGAPCDPTDNSCDDNFTPLDELEYCTQNPSSAARGHRPYNCTYWDANQDVYMQQSSVLMTTRVAEYNQTRTCHPAWTPGVNTCKKLWTNDAPHDDGETFFIADMERYTLLLDHTVIGPTINVSASGRACQGWLKVTQDAIDPAGLCRRSDAVKSDSDLVHTVGGGFPPECYLKPNTTYDSHTGNETGLDVFDIEVMLAVAGIDLEGTSPTNDRSIRYNGAAMVVNIRYQNWAPGRATSINLGRTDPDLGCTVPYEYELSSVLDTASKRQTVVHTSYPNKRALLNEHGVRLFVLQTGSLGSFDMATLLIAVTSSLTLLAVSSTLVDMLAVYVLPEKKYYNGFKYPETPHVSELVEEEQERVRKTTLANQQLANSIVSGRQAAGCHKSPKCTIIGSLYCLCCMNVLCVVFGFLFLADDGIVRPYDRTVILVHITLPVC